MTAPKIARGFPKPASTSWLSPRWSRGVSGRDHSRLYASTYRPDKPNEFAGDRCDHDWWCLSPGEHSAIPGAEANLRLPGDGADFGRSSFLPALHGLSDFRRHAVSPSRLDDQFARDDAAGFGDARRPSCFAAGALSGDQAEVGHELARIIKALEVADFGDHAGRHGERDAAEGLQRFDDRSERPVRQEGLDLLLDLQLSLDGLIHGVEMGLESDLLRRMVEGLVAKPNAMAALPNRAGISSTIAKEKPLNALTRLPDILAGDLARSDEIAHRLVSVVGRPNLGQLAGA
jgi:hypothetical protein